MNAATAMREFRKRLSTGEDPKTAYNIYKDFFNYSELSSITDDNLLYDIILYMAETKDRKILKFANGLSNEEFDIDRYQEYKKFRHKNKFDSSSVEFFKVKFGHNWRSHYEDTKSNRFNMYSVEDNMLKYNINREEAERIVELNKEKTTNTIDKYIKKYGKKDGEKKFFENCRRHKNYIEYWVKQYPEDYDMAYKKFKEYTTTSNRYHKNFYTKRGYTEDEAIEIISKLQRTSAGVHREFYKSRGMTEEEIDGIMGAINAKKDSSSIVFVRKKYNSEDEEDILDLYKKINNRKSSTYRVKGFRKQEDPEINERNSYYNQVTFYTRISEHCMDQCPGPRGKTKESYHLDHIYSVYEGYRNRIPPEIIGHVTNLQWVKSSENCSKKDKCHKTKEQLIKDYEEYENKKN